MVGKKKGAEGSNQAQGGSQPPAVLVYYGHGHKHQPNSIDKYLDKLERGDKNAHTDIRGDMDMIQKEGKLPPLEQGGKFPGMKGNVEQLRGYKNLYELRNHRGPGHRVYIMAHEGHVVFLDAKEKPGEKKQHNDIATAAAQAEDWKNRYKAGDFREDIKEAHRLMESRRHGKPDMPVTSPHESHHKGGGKHGFSGAGRMRSGLLALAWQGLMGLLSSAPPDTQAAPSPPPVYEERQQAPVIPPVKAFSSLSPAATTPPLHSEQPVMHNPPRTSMKKGLE